MVIKVLLDSLNLVGAQTFYIYESIEVVMVYKDENFVFALLQIVVPSFK